jgi:dihydrolipoamide dehydrogenase
VDIIQAQGIFTQTPSLVLEVENRYLRSRAYLLAMGSEPDFSELSQFSQTTFPKPIWTAQTLDNSTDWQEGNDWVIIGAKPLGIELAHHLATLEKKVTLSTRNSHLLPQEDRESAHFLQSSLEAIGVKILLKTDVQAIQSQTAQFQMEIRDHFLEQDFLLNNIDHIFWAQKNKVNLGGLNLAEIGVQFNKNRLVVNPQLQTHCPEIYAIGSAIAGYDLPSLAQYEARLVLQNTLVGKQAAVNYYPIPVCLTEAPQFARVGLTEAQAQGFYGNQYQVKRSRFSTFSAQSKSQPSGFCKLILDPQQQIIGTHLIGDHAKAWINVFALVIAQKLRLNDLQNLNLPGLELT